MPVVASNSTDLGRRVGWGSIVVVGREYILRQARALLDAAEQATDYQQIADLIQQAADLIALVDDLSAPASDIELH
jgi:hypothetical protein